ncbi:hypothetical protein [Streptomyces griseus]|uniref:hypothetical protein n=1 Tax=Streptomyces griseus TaxID=1911 RepID=UPI00099C2AEB|nr:hypothetical protein [Streptomyces griseus]
MIPTIDPVGPGPNGQEDSTRATGTDGPGKKMHKRHAKRLATQAVLALARRRVNVLWALLRGGRCHELTPPGAHAA